MKMGAGKVGPKGRDPALGIDWFMMCSLSRFKSSVHVMSALRSHRLCLHCLSQVIFSEAKGLRKVGG